MFIFFWHIFLFNYELNLHSQYLEAKLETKQKQALRPAKKKVSIIILFFQSQNHTDYSNDICFSRAKKMLATKKCKVTFPFDCPAEQSHGPKAVSSSLFHKEFNIFFSFNQHIHFGLIMAPIHKTVKLACYFQSCTEGEKGKKGCPRKKCSSLTKRAGNNNHRHFINYQTWNCFKIRWRFQTRVTSLHYLGKPY